MASTPSILVVDDELAFCTVVCEILEMFGYRAHKATSVRQALGLLENLVPDLILTDIMMPDIDGLALLKRVRECPALANIPTVVISAMGSDRDLIAAERAGASAFLVKPFSAEELRQTIARFIPEH
jgi:chemosensory pili system protein ChpA (sensor histidine kinase/response regulator)